MYISIFLNTPKILEKLSKLNLCSVSVRSIPSQTSNVRKLHLKEQQHEKYILNYNLF